MQNHLQNHPNGQICPVLTVGWHLLSDFVVKGWKSDFCHSSRVKIELFPKKKRIELTFEYLTNKSRYPRDVFSPSFSEHDPVIDSKYINLHASSVHLLTFSPILASKFHHTPPREKELNFLWPDHAVGGLLLPRWNCTCHCDRKGKYIKCQLRKTTSHWANQNSIHYLNFADQSSQPSHLPTETAWSRGNWLWEGQMTEPNPSYADECQLPHCFLCDQLPIIS